MFDTETAGIWPSRSDPKRRHAVCRKRSGGSERLPAVNQNYQKISRYCLEYHGNLEYNKKVKKRGGKIHV